MDVLLQLPLQSLSYLLWFVPILVLLSLLQSPSVVVSPFGLFIIETKNMTGWIFGSEKQAEWTQKIFRKHSRFQNPLRQNHKHVKAVEELLNVSPDTLHSIVAFVGSAEPKTEMPPNVFFDGGMTAYIQSFRQVVFTMQQVEELFIELYVKAIPSTRGSRKRHLEGLRRRFGGNPISPPTRKSRS